MKRQILALFGLLALTCWAAVAADIDGTWTAQVEGANGKVTETLKLQARGNQLTGTMHRRGTPREISEGTMNGNLVSFKVVRDRKGKSITQQYKGTISGGVLKLNISGRGGEAKEVVYKKK